MIPTLETARLTLRAPCKADVPLYVDFFAQASGPGMYGGPRPAYDAVERLAQDIGLWHLNGMGRWVIVPKDADHGVGGCGIIDHEGWPGHELTWWLMPSARGKGVALEAARAAITYGYDTLGLDPVETYMRDGNAAAHALAERLGGTITRRTTFPDGVDRSVYALPRPEEA